MPSEVESWEQRHRAILAILRRSPVRRQEELVSRLAERGFEVTQSSVSRDLRELVIDTAPTHGATPSQRTAPP